MYKMLIVDDEPWLRKRLLQTIDWKQFGIDELYEAEDGTQALMMAVAHEPDLLITDINMPDLSGIDLLKTLQEAALCPQTILISGYNEFEYARSALHLGVMDYLLKPIDEQKLLSAVAKCVDTLEQARYRQDVYERLSASSEELNKRIFADLVFYRINFYDLSIAQRKDLAQWFSSSAMVVSVWTIVDPLLGQNNVDATITSLSVQESLQSMIDSVFPGSLLFTRENETVLLLFTDQEEEVLLDEIHSALFQADQALSRDFPIHLAYVAGSMVYELSALQHSYRETQSRPVIFLGGHREDNNFSSDLLPNLGGYEGVYDEYNLQALISAIRSSNKAEAYTLLGQLIAEFTQRTPDSVSSLKLHLFYINVLNTLLKACLPQFIPSQNVLSACLDCTENADAFRSIGAIRASLKKLIEALLAEYAERTGIRRHWLIGQIIQYIRENYCAPISMRDVARAFYLNSSYFCKLFKEETGTTFTNYLIELRIHEAKRMMLEGNMKLYDIASAVGYTNEQYFSTIFKEKEGISLSQYRSLHTPRNK